MMPAAKSCHTHSLVTFHTLTRHAPHTLVTFTYTLSFTYTLFTFTHTHLSLRPHTVVAYEALSVLKRGDTHSLKEAVDHLLLRICTHTHTHTHTHARKRWLGEAGERQKERQERGSRRPALRIALLRGGAPVRCSVLPSHLR